ncbi:MAG: hypothetical protein JWO20_263 [Candidatus Angelobacter sp.]|nr:hypothetical protein [Candidatus Angelobacter sp.]
MSTSPSNAPAGTRSAEDIVRQTQVAQSPNGICYAASGENAIDASDLERLIAAVPHNIAGSLERKAYYFVPLAIGEGESTLISERYDVALSDRAVCHRNLNLGDSQCVFISTRLMDDKFSVAFEFYINVGHAFVERAGVSQDFADLVWKQVEAGARGETSLDAYDFRRQALVRSESDTDSTARNSPSQRSNNKGNAKMGAFTSIDEKAKTNYLTAAFSDAVAIYLLSLYIDVDYYDLREREYPLLAPQALAERLRKIADLFPANPGYEFAVYYRRRT